MPYRLRDFPALFRTPLGRRKLLAGAMDRAWPLFCGMAGLYRRTAVRTTRVVAVVGSFGKTTTARAVVTALGGTPPSIPYNARTPLAGAILRIRPRQRHAVVEVGIDRRGQMAEYARMVCPDITVVTAVGSDHNRSLGTLEDIRAEKAHMVRTLPPAGMAVLNGDDPNVRWMATQTRARVLTVGFEATNDIRASRPILDWPYGTRVTLHADTWTRDVRVRLMGRTMVYPILAAVAIALAEGRAPDPVISALEALGPMQGRLQPVPLANGALLLRDEFKASLETIEAALDVLADIPATRRIVVLGDVQEPVGSPRAICRHIGERIGRIASRAIFVTGENVSAYRVGAIRGGMPRSAVQHAGRSPGRAVEALQQELASGDVVLIKGRQTQRLERAALALAGRRVGCDIPVCNERVLTCDRCPMLERGWAGLRVVT
jgi:UDP-N-acetylmuramyl pentapeptide synthase